MGVLVYELGAYEPTMSCTPLVTPLIYMTSAKLASWVPWQTLKITSHPRFPTQN